MEQKKEEKEANNNGKLWKWNLGKHLHGTR